MVRRLLSVCTSVLTFVYGTWSLEFLLKAVANHVANLLDYIDKKTHEIKQDEDKVVYKSLEEIGDDLPDNSPRYILLSYPLTLVRLPYIDTILRGAISTDKHLMRAAAIRSLVRTVRPPVLPAEHV